MKQMRFWMMAAILFCGAGCFTSCHGGDNDSKTDEDSTKVDNVNIKEESRLQAVDRFMVDSIGKQYAPGEVCIPCVQIVDVNDQDPTSVLVWGDFWVFNYNVVGDTLKCVSGGSHPGMMCLQKLDNGYVVVGFDQVADGSEYMPTAKRIFGDKYDAFEAIHSNENSREDVRARLIADYVLANDIPVRYYQDFGWPAKEIPED